MVVVVVVVVVDVVVGATARDTVVDVVGGRVVVVVVLSPEPDCGPPVVGFDGDAVTVTDCDAAAAEYTSLPD